MQVSHLKKDNFISGTKSKKYFLSKCNLNINDIGDLVGRDTKEFLVINRIIKNPEPFNDYFQEGSGILGGILNKSQDIVVKIFSTNDFAEKEYKISEYFYNNGYDGFVKYLCKFSCQDDINKYSKIDTDTYICDKDGKVKITSLLMEIFELGSIKDFSWNADNFYILKDLLKKTLEILFKVSKETGFIHRDLHCGNIMIKKNAYGNYYPVIIDLEKSLFVNNNEINKYKYTSLDKDKPLEKIIAINDLKDLFSKLMFLNNSKINIDVTDILKHVRYISDNETTFDSLQDFYRLIDKMEIYG